MGYQGVEIGKMERLIRLLGSAGLGRLLAAVFSVAILGTGQITRADEELPSGADVIDKFVKSTGGRQAYLRIKNRVRKGRIEDVRTGLLKLALYEAEPNETYYRTEGEWGVSEQGTHGDIAWMQIPRDGPRVLQGQIREKALLQSFFHMPAKWREVVKEAKCTEITQFQGKQCYKVVMTLNTGDKEIWYIEKDTALRRGRSETFRGREVLTFVMTDYKEVDGILYPHRLERIAGKRKFGPIIYESIEHNVDLPKDRFDPPETIVKLIESQEEGNQNED